MENATNLKRLYMILVLKYKLFFIIIIHYFKLFAFFGEVIWYIDFPMIFKKKNFLGIGYLDSYLCWLA